jgi:hypothetical protein
MPDSRRRTVYKRKSIRRGSVTVTSNRKKIGTRALPRTSQPMPPIRGSRVDVNGVIKLKLNGTAYEVGYAHGHLLKAEIHEMLEMFRFYMPYRHGRSVEFFIKLVCDFFLPNVKARYPEIYREMEGIAEGAGVPVNRVLFLNSALSLEYLYASLPTVLKTAHPSLRRKYRNFLEDCGVGVPAVHAEERCTAFIATGSYTRDGKIVCAHNTNGKFIESQYYNVMVELRPKTGHAITMQTAPGLIFSGSDFFVTGAGIIGTETTIKWFTAYKHRDPIFCRIRKCMQYGNTLDDYVATLLKHNSGDYACSWLFGSIKTGEIMCLELGANYHSLRRTKDGVFVGANGVLDPKIRNLECSPEAGLYHHDTRTSVWARHHRVAELVEAQRGKLDLTIGAKILADHYDVYLKKYGPGSNRSICKHSELDDARHTTETDVTPFMPDGSIDAAVTDATIASRMSFLYRFGNSCGAPFKKIEYFAKHPQWEHLAPYIKDRPSQPWIKIGA